jgi:hypothetical protein
MLLKRYYFTMRFICLQNEKLSLTSHFKTLASVLWRRSAVSRMNPAYDSASFFYFPKFA